MTNTWSAKPVYFYYQYETEVSYYIIFQEFKSLGWSLLNVIALPP